MIDEVVLNFATNKLSFDLSSKDCQFELSTQDNLSFTLATVNIYNAPHRFYNWCRPEPMKDDLYELKMPIILTATAHYVGGMKKTLFSNQIENSYQQIYTPPNSILTIKTCSILISQWANKPLKKPLTVKNRSFKEICQENLGKKLGSFDIPDFVVSGNFINNLDVILDNQLDGLRVRYFLSFENNKVHFTSGANKKTIDLTDGNGLKSVPVITNSDAAFMIELLKQPTYYQVQFNTVLGLLTSGQQVKVRDYRGRERNGFITNISRGFSSLDGGSDTVVLQEGLTA